MTVVLPVEHNSPEWYDARLGIPTSSMFSTVLAKGRDGGDSKTRRTYMLKLAGERLTGTPMDNYTNEHMERGHEFEDEARDAYAFLKDAEPERVGFLYDEKNRTGCSPDALIGADGVLEIKTALAHILIGYIDKNAFPSEHKAQCQGALWITERAWVDIAIYCPGLPLFVKRAEREEEYIGTLARAVAQFNAELDELTERVRRYGQPSTLKADLVASNILMAG